MIDCDTLSHNGIAYLVSLFSIRYANFMKLLPFMFWYLAQFSFMNCSAI